MMTLSHSACLVGALLAVVYGLMLLFPAKARDVLLRFPRSRWPGIALTAIDLTWVSYVVAHAYLGKFAFLRPYVYPAGALAFFLIIFFMDELLAPRALGGLMLLVAKPLMDIARWHDSSWRIVMMLLAYLIVIKGMLLVLGPFRFRKWVRWMVESDRVLRCYAAAGMVVSVLLIGLSCTAY